MTQEENNGLKISNKQQFQHYCDLISEERDLADTSKHGYDEKKEAIYSVNSKGFIRNCISWESQSEDPLFFKRVQGLFYHTLSEWNRYGGKVSDKKKEELSQSLEDTLKCATGINRKKTFAEIFHAYHKLIDVLPGTSEELEEEKDYFRNKIDSSRHFKFMNPEPETPKTEIKIQRPERSL